MLLIRDLGELVVESDARTHDPGGTKPRTILALLCAGAGAGAGNSVPASTLITEVWGPDAPEKTQRALESQMWRLRKALSPDSDGRSPITTDRTGYRLDGSSVRLDSAMFEAAAARVSTGHDASSALRHLDDALSLWRGEPFTTAASTPTLDQARRRLHTVRTSLLTRRADLLLAGGHIERALDEAQALITRDPLDEHAWTLKIGALAASGQRAEALTAYRDIRELLATELGMDPGEELRAAHRTVLDDHSRAVRRIHLPSQHTSFVGRDHELAALVRLLGSERAISITGIPGVGKTRLALEAARRAADSFDDGVWFVPRRAGTDDAGAILATMRVQPSADAPAPLDQVCAHLSMMSALLVLDGARPTHPLQESSHRRPATEQSAPHIDATHIAVSRTTDTDTIDTSTTDTETADTETASASVDPGRTDAPPPNVVDAILQRCAAVTILGVGVPLGVEGEHVVTVHPLPVDITAGNVGPPPAHRLLTDRIRVAVGNFDPDDADQTDLDRICRAMGGLPLGLELAAARTATFSLHEVAEQFGAAMPEPVQRAFTLAYESLGEDLADTFLRLTALRSPFTPTLAESVCGNRASQVTDALTELTRRSLLWPIRGDRHRPTRFTVLSTVAEHARTADPAAARAALLRRDEAIAALLTTTPMRSSPTSARDLARVDHDHHTVVAFLESVVADPVKVEEHVDLIDRLGPYWFLRRRLADGIRLLRRAARTCSTGRCSPRTQALVTLSLGAALAFSQLTDEAHRHLTAITLDDLDVLTADDDPETRTLRMAFVTLAAWTGDDHDLASQLSRRAGSALTTGPDTQSIAATVTATVALCELTAGDIAAGSEHAHSALALSTELGDPLAMHLACVMMGIGALFDGDTTMGLKWNDQAFRAYLDAGGVQICDTIEQRGNHLAAATDIRRAAAAFAVARTYAADAGMAWPRNPFTHDAVRRCRESDNATFEAGWRDGSAAARDALATGDHERFAGM
ncbi:BTAD domain-containing putative transcriptional regulator [Gordonia sp. ABSL11-1]|uniref:AfsR/SARP family transcriptional regulator n=1 Tax=Gordonia sp. ABSL11-1 TaxID=3053924 RepID=UPI00257226AE|nr:BTAD domain-containing putative transcriptional regulator [Gordonia sp. ABSL11-1]MDL9946585.1 BTAD domain-containing putative transcriptional regulator [Gordonia sp. ABSL11-1]